MYVFVALSVVVDVGWLVVVVVVLDVVLNGVVSSAI